MFAPNAIDVVQTKLYDTTQYMFSQEAMWLLEEKYRGEKSAAFFTDVTRLEAGEPLAYIIGSIPFLNTIINLDSNPLIPRPETEFWVEKVIAIIDAKQAASSLPLHILDLCAGSGCIGIAIAKAIPRSFIDFIELEKRHLPTIKKNCAQNQIADERFRVFAGNLFEINSVDELPKYDFIICNPPYIDPTLDRTEISVKKFEPALALYGGAAGMELIEKIITHSPANLTRAGQLWLEHEPEQVEAISNLAQTVFKTTTHKDQYNIPRFSQLVLQ